MVGSPFASGVRPWRSALGLAFAFALIALLLVSYGQSGANALAANATRTGSASVTQGSLPGASPAPQTTVIPTTVQGLAAGIPGLSLGIAANPKTVCAYNGLTCPAGVGQSRVTMSAQASPNGLESWPAVQVAFVVETTSYDGVYDPGAGDSGSDTCASSGSGVCEESNGVCFFVTHAQQIANAIQAANPHSQVSFALVDYFATLDNFDDGDGAEYHVDIPQFVGANSFGPAVSGTFQATQLGGGCIYSDADLSDNILHSSSITALFGTIIGSGLDWSKNTHHVIAWMGSTVPRDTAYQVNYCVTPSDYAGGFFGGSCLSSGCEPAYSYGSITSPQCEGWVRSQDGNATHSIAGLARSAPSCTDSIGGVCTVDMIDLWDGMTDPYSKAWPTADTNSGGGPGGPVVQQDVAKVLLAGCDLSAATGGTWNGPSFFACPNGQQGGLNYVPLGSPYTPNTANPTLLAAFRAIGFGPIQTTLVANGTNQPLFQFVPYGNVRLAPDPQFASACTLQNGVLWSGNGRCDQKPQQFNFSGNVYYGWNWSDNASQNAMYVGDTWEVSFNIVVNGPPYTTIPVDACVTFACKLAGSSAVQGLFTSATYLPVTNHTQVTQSFPVAQIAVETTPIGPPPVTGAPPPPPVPPPIPLAIPPGIPVISPIGISAQVGVANVALQATAAGFLAAGFMRVSQKNRPISMAVAALSGKNFKSKFDGATPGKDTGIGRFE